ncbi:hypothetical protein D3C87_1564570 [compost metagenome]
MPVGEELDFHMLDAVVLENIAHRGNAQLVNVMQQVCMDEPHASPTGFRGGLRSILQGERADFAGRAGVRIASESPIGSKEFDIFSWHDDHL